MANPYSAFGDALHASRELSRETLTDIACRVRYLDYMQVLTRTQFENTLAVCLSDLFERFEDETVQKFVKGERVEEVRSRPQYAQMRGEMQQASIAIQSLDGGETSSEWVRRRARDARNAIERTMLRSKSPKEVLVAATEILERDMPKASRLQGGSSVILFREQDAELVERAMKVVSGVEKKERKALRGAGAKDVSHAEAD